jgi:hypothetical protein
MATSSNFLYADGLSSSHTIGTEKTLQAAITDTDGLWVAEIDFAQTCSDGDGFFIRFYKRTRGSVPTTIRVVKEDYFEYVANEGIFQSIPIPSESGDNLSLRTLQDLGTGRQLHWKLYNLRGT